ncbi:MAG: tryptophan synthase subunit alpha [Clostridium sp.]|nr:tryptophan synthase subunit alpha [Clostridium sp.]MCM1546782.1 tryptophan synthase subunit alpha [Ruminococcus sp.]
MKNRIEAKLEELKNAGKKALITYVTCGDGGYETTEAAVMEMINAGADIIELGVPFSDPIAEGPVIQSASVRALSGGTTLAGIFDMVKRLRRQTDTPLLLMLYLNSIFGFGTERFFDICAEIGIDGVIVPDMPYEEKDEIQPYADDHNIISISLVTPTSNDRIEKIASSAKGFVYCVSSTGVTGMRSSFKTDFSEFISEIKKYTDIPCAIGFGISNAQQAHEIKQHCDGVIIGSAIVNIIAEHQKKCAKPVHEFVASVREGLDS